MSNIKLSYFAVQGRSHIKNNIPCQDRVFGINKKTQKGYYSSIALCDGAGSKKNSLYGADISSKFIVQYVLANFNRLFEKNYSTHMLKAIEKRLFLYSKSKNIEFDSLASTLLFVSILDDRFIAGHIGDGVIGYVVNDEIKVLSHPENGEFANSTYFTTSINIKDRLRVYKGDMKNINGFVLMSDGTAESFYDKNKKELIRQTKDIIYWLKHDSQKEVTKALKHNLEKYISQRTIDDCSIGLIYKS